MYNIWQENQGFCWKTLAPITGLGGQDFWKRSMCFFDLQVCYILNLPLWVEEVLILTAVLGELGDLPILSIGLQMFFFFFVVGVGIRFSESLIINDTTSNICVVFSINKALNIVIIFLTTLRGETPILQWKNLVEDLESGLLSHVPFSFFHTSLPYCQNLIDQNVFLPAFTFSVDNYSWWLIFEASYCQALIKHFIWI